jgi:hypothetical protein
MGKRSEYKRIERDNYTTPVAAVIPLLPHLAPRTRFIEPCAGAGKLVEHLTLARHVLVRAYDLPDDARSHRYDIPAGAIIVTNPPLWGRPGLREIIVNLSDQAPAWLLMPGDWLFNLSSAPLIPRLRTVAAIGRVKWIPDSPYTSKDNCAWMLFERPSAWAQTRFVGRIARERVVETMDAIPAGPEQPPPAQEPIGQPSQPIRLRLLRGWADGQEQRPRRPLLGQVALHSNVTWHARRKGARRRG